MNEITIKFIGKDNVANINIKNEAFNLFGHMFPYYQDGKWGYSVIESKEISTDIFPDENYVFENMEKDHFFIGAYDGEMCIGLAIFQMQWHKYVYLHDLKVNSAYRGQRIATKMIEESEDYLKRLNYRGIWTIAQNNNLGACLFYINNGFRIGGLDTETYNGTKLEGVFDIHFYKEI